MAGKKLDWAPPGLGNARTLTGADLDRAEKLLPCPLANHDRQRFRERLSWIAAQYRLDTQWSAAPPPSQQAKHLLQIAAASRRLLKSLGHAGHFDPDEPWPIAYPGTWRGRLQEAAGQDELVRATLQVQNLEGWGNQAAQDAQHAIQEAKTERLRRYGDRGHHARRKENEPLNDAIGRLALLYQRVTGSRPGIGRPGPDKAKRPPAGPFVRFCCGVLALMGVNQSPQALESRWQDIKHLVRAADQIRKKRDSARLARGKSAS